ncbi:MAG: hypothetical protein ACOYOD_14400 [Saprospiraceae bacterium]|jgi:hypothetical protein
MTAMQQFPDHARVWVYQSNRPFSQEEIEGLNQQLGHFARQWVSHNQLLKASAQVVHDRFIVLMVDEGQVGAGGCSIDRSVAFLKSLQAEYGMDLFDRMLFSYRDGENIVTLSRDAFAKRYQEGAIHDETVVFDPLISDKASFDRAFAKPLSESWMKRMV